MPGRTRACPADVPAFGGATEEFRKLAARTQADYRKIIDKKIEPAFGDLPIAALSESKKACRGEFKE